MTAACRRCGRKDCNHTDAHYQGIVPHVPSAQLTTGLPLECDRFVSASFHAPAVSTRNMAASAGQTNIKSSPAQKASR